MIDKTLLLECVVNIHLPKYIDCALKSSEHKFDLVKKKKKELITPKIPKTWKILCRMRKKIAPDYILLKILYKK